MARDNLLVGLDVGTTKIVAIVGEIGPDGEVTIVGFGEVPSTGLRKGAIVDIEGTVKAIEQAVIKAERMSGAEVNSALVALSGPHLTSVNNRGVVAVANSDNEIASEDVKRVLEAAQVIALPAERRIVHVLPRGYVVDGYEGILDPVGMTGIRLEVEAHVITGANTAIQNLIKSINRAGIQVTEMVVSPLAAGEAVLFPAERELGVVLVDLGGGTTDLAIFDQGGLWYTAVLPIGGDHVTSDLAVGLRTTLQQAEAVKCRHGCGLIERTDESEIVEVPGLGGTESHRVPRRLIAGIMEPRLREILNLVKREIRRSGYPGLLPGGVVLTGGLARVEGLSELAAAELEMPARIGIPQGIGGMADMLGSPAYATAVGLLKYGAKKSQVSWRNGNGQDSFLGDLVYKVKGWFKEFF